MKGFERQAGEPGHILRDYRTHRLSKLMNEDSVGCLVEPSCLLDNSLVMREQDDLSLGGKVR